MFAHSVLGAALVHALQPVDFAREAAMDSEVAPHHDPAHLAAKEPVLVVAREDDSVEPLAREHEAEEVTPRVEDLCRLAREHALLGREPDEQLDECEETQCEPVLVLRELVRIPAEPRGQHCVQRAEGIECGEWVRLVVR